MQNNLEYERAKNHHLAMLVDNICLNPPKRMILPSDYPFAPGFKVQDTSKSAAESIKPRAKRLEARVLDVIRSFPFGCSPERVCEELEENILSIRPRFSQLKAKGLIADSGRRDKTLCGKQSIIWIGI